MGVVRVEKNRYTTESLYQWDKNQVLQIYGLSLPTAPEIHFTNAAMSCSLVRYSQMSGDGVITVNVPNSLLQQPYKIIVHVCRYDSDTFESLYKLEIPVNARNKPGDYVLEVTDEEIYSFRALEKLVDDTLEESRADYNRANSAYSEALNNMATANETLAEAIEHTEETARDMVADANEISANTIKQVDDTLVAKTSEIDTALAETLTEVDNKLSDKANSGHTHGDITADGKIGSAADMFVTTGVDGLVGVISPSDARTKLDVYTKAEVEAKIVESLSNITDFEGSEF